MNNQDIGFEEFLAVLAATVGALEERLARGAEERKQIAMERSGSAKVMQITPVYELRYYHGFRVSGLSFEFDFLLQKKLFGGKNSSFLAVLEGALPGQKQSDCGHMKIVFGDGDAGCTVFVDDRVFMEVTSVELLNKAVPVPEQQGFIARMFGNIYARKSRSTRLMLTSSRAEALRLFLKGV